MSSPIQFGHITVDGTSYPVKFGPVVSAEFCEIMAEKLKRPYDLPDMNAFFFEKGEDGKSKLEKMQTTGTEVMVFVYAAFKEGARIEGIAFDWKDYRDAADMVTLMNSEPDTWAQFFGIYAKLPGLNKEQESPNEKPKAAKLKAA